MKGFVLLTAMLLFMIVVHAQRPADANFDEAKVKPYVLPDVLRTTKHTKIRSKADWENNRPQMLRLFEDHIYGQMPRQFDDIKFSVLKEDKSAMQGRATLKQVVVEVFNHQQSVKLDLVYLYPTRASRLYLPFC